MGNISVYTAKENYFVLATDTHHMVIDAETIDIEGHPTTRNRFEEHEDYTLVARLYPYRVGDKINPLDDVPCGTIVLNQNRTLRKKVTSDRWREIESGVDHGTSGNDATIVRLGY